MGVRPIFVVGSPRSGTTMIGNYLGGARSVLNAGEYRALYLAHGTLSIQLSAAYRLAGVIPTAWEPYRDQYINEVQRHAAEFIERVATQEGCTFYCDSSPRNVLIGSKLAEIFPDALFVLTLRHYTGTIQSLLRLKTIRLLPGFESSFDSTDPTAIAAAMIWSRHYRASFNLPNDRTIAFGYDRFCADPQSVISQFKDALGSAGFPIAELDDSVFSTSHATEPGQARATAGTTAGQRVRLEPIQSFDPDTWSGINEMEVREAVYPTDQLLRSIFGDDYADPIGYPGSEALIEEARASSAPTPPADAAGSQASSAERGQRDPARRKAPKQR